MLNAMPGPATASLTITADEIGTMLMPHLRHPARWVRKHHAELTEKEGMPRKLPGGWVWSRLAVMAWIGTYGAPRAARAEAADTLIRRQQREVMEAFAGRAA